MSKQDTLAAAVEVDDLDAWYGETPAVSGVTLRLPAGRVSAVIGPSGCGKSTFLRTLNRMHELTEGAGVSGRVVVAGRPVYGEDIDPVAVRRRTGMVFQRPNPFVDLSVADNVLAGPRLHGVVEDPDELIERSLRRAHLWDEVRDRLDRPAGGLSGGQQQRLCIARALAVEPEVLLMDEPTSALDPVSTEAVEDLVRELVSWCTVVLVTHDLAQASRVSEVTAFFTSGGPGKPGRLVEIDATEKLFHDPADPATAAYVAGRG
ncbi:MAG: phosphate ABC transporter ATP-binding protein [Marmoricola sp.]